MDDHKLICLVQSRAGLYNKMSTDFRNKNKKKQLWEDIAKKMSTTPLICERRWTSLRDRFNKELKKTDGASRSGAMVQCTWPHFHSMSFLRAHLLHRNPRSNFGLEVPNPIDNCTEIPLQGTSVVDDCTSEGAESSESEVSFSAVCMSDISTTTLAAPMSSQSSSRARKRRNTDTDVKKPGNADPISSACGTMVTTVLAAMGTARRMQKIVVITKLLEEWSRESEN